MIANSPIRTTARLRRSIQTSIYSADDILHILLLIFTQGIVNKRAIRHSWLYWVDSVSPKPGKNF